MNHCRCGHSSPPHTADACHRCDCDVLEICRCEGGYCNRCGIPHGGPCKRPEHT